MIKIRNVYLALRSLGLKAPRYRDWVIDRYGDKYLHETPGNQTH